MVGDGLIPFRLRIGVTGHRRLPDDPALAAQVVEVIGRIQRRFAESSTMPLRLTIVSPLAEGADRLVARMVLASPNATLEVPLPMPESEYIDDFKSEESRYEFVTLLDKADAVIELPETRSRLEAYDLVGQYVVGRCDVLVALWDGGEIRTRGGTANVVAQARARDLALYWIGTQAPFPILEERTNRPPVSDAVELGHFNGPHVGHGIRIDHALMRQRVAGQTARWVAAARAAGLDPVLVERYCAWVLPFQVRADALAHQYQTAFRRASARLFLLPAVAVLLAVLGAVLWAMAATYPDLRDVLFVPPGLEAVTMAFILVLLWRGRRHRLHRRWIDYRFLGERLRAMVFLALARDTSGRRIRAAPEDLRPASAAARGGAAGFLVEAMAEILFLLARLWWRVRRQIQLFRRHSEKVPEPREVRHRGETQPSNDWLSRAIDEVWLGCRRLPLEDACPALRQFIAEQWIGVQIEYHERTSRRLANFQREIEDVVALIFLMTLLAAVAHFLVDVVNAARTREPETLNALLVGGALILLAAALPAFAGGVHGVGAQQEYTQNSQRYAEMARYLQSMRARMLRSRDTAELRALVQDVDRQMLDENRDWLSVMRFHDLELHV